MSNIELLPSERKQLLGEIAQLKAENIFLLEQMQEKE